MDDLISELDQELVGASPAHKGEHKRRTGGAGGRAGRTAERSRTAVQGYSGMGIRTFVDGMGYEVPQPPRLSVIRRAPCLLRRVAELWADDGLCVMGQQFVGAHVVVGSILEGCTVRQQENVYGTNLQVLVIAHSGSGKSKVALLDRLVERIDRELREQSKARREAYRRDMQLYNMALSAWKADGGRGDCPREPSEPLPGSLLMADNTTGAAVVRWLAGNDGRLSLMRHDELTTLMNSLNDKDNGQFTDLIKKGFDNARHVKQLRTDDEGYYIQHVGLAILISTTPDVLCRFLRPVYDDGTGSRLIGFFSPTSASFDATPKETVMTTFDTTLAACADEVHELHDAVVAWRDRHPEASLRLMMTEDQEHRFTAHFQRLMTTYVALEDIGDDAISSVRRRAVDAKRLMMIWTMCRRLEELQRDSAGQVFLPDDGLMAITDDDFRAVLELTDCLLCHSLFMTRTVKGLPKDDEEPATRTKPADHLRLLTDTFLMTDVVITAEQCGISRSQAYRRLTRWQTQGLVRKTGDAEYQKTPKARTMTRKK